MTPPRWSGSVEGRRAGLIVLLLAAVLLITVPRALTDGIAGAAVRASLPAPPPVGSCLVGPGNEVVDCTQPHDAEVTSIPAAGSPGAGDGASCQDDYVRMPAMMGEYDGYWSPPPVNYQFTLVSGPADVTDPRFAWRACLVLPLLPASYLGTIVDAATPIDRPGAYGECVEALGPDPLFSAGQISCLEPHRAEIVGYASGFLPDDASLTGLDVPALPADDEIGTECAGIASTRIGTGDPTFGGRLAVEVEFQRGSTSLLKDGSTIPGTFVTAACAVQTVGASLLTDSIVGLGDGALPLR